jgi:hypothetical protein
MGEARRNKQLRAVCGAEFETHPRAVGRTAPANVDCNIEDRPSPAAHQLDLGMRSCLEMHPTHGSDLRREQVIALYELNVDSSGCQDTATIGFAKKPR